MHSKYEDIDEKVIQELSSSLNFWSVGHFPEDFKGVPVEFIYIFILWKLANNNSNIHRQPLLDKRYETITKTWIYSQDSRAFILICCWNLNNWSTAYEKDHQEFGHIIFLWFER